MRKRMRTAGEAIREVYQRHNGNGRLSFNLGEDGIYRETADGARLALWTIPSLEWFSLEAPIVARPWPAMAAANYSSLVPVSRISFPKRGISVFRNAASSADEPVLVSMPSVSNRFCTSGVCAALATSA
jgi:hypothetical protein